MSIPVFAWRTCGDWRAGEAGGSRAPSLRQFFMTPQIAICTVPPRQTDVSANTHLNLRPKHLKYRTTNKRGRSCNESKRASASAAIQNKSANRHETAASPAVPLVWSHSVRHSSCSPSIAVFIFAIHRRIHSHRIVDRSTVPLRGLLFGNATRNHHSHVSSLSYPVTSVPPLAKLDRMTNI